ncbi:hypothetical protein CDAR_420131 [Caerostris darwini]|uniref:Uncharacterized protein n=1 Tax=Caerostris darwini TaxID=1538125 RepID=A0AAV4T9P0_9ARAC|nr:hypothetical protein CDAR_420131 [Caerostris darwini]
MSEFLVEARMSSKICSTLFAVTSCQHIPSGVTVVEASAFGGEDCRAIMEGILGACGVGGSGIERDSSWANLLVVLTKFGKVNIGGLTVFRFGGSFNVHGNK